MNDREKPYAELIKEFHELRESYDALQKSIENVIDDGKRAEDQLRQQEVRFELMLEYSSDILLFLDKDGFQRYISPSAEAITGYPIEELKKSFTAVVHPDDVERVNSVFLDLLTNPRQILKGEYRHLHKGGGFRYFEAIGRNFLDDPVLQGLVINIRDITDRKLAEQQLREKELTYHLLADNMTDTVWLMDMDLKFVYISPSFEKLRGFSLADLQQIPLDKILTPESYKIMMETAELGIPKALADPTFSPQQTVELDFYTPDGILHSTETKLNLIRDKEGRPTNILGVDRDITERKQAEKALRESESSLDEAQEIGKMGSWVLNLSTNELIWSKNLYRIFGYEPFGIEPTHDLFYNQVHPDDLNIINEAYDYVNETKTSISLEMRIILPDGKVKWILNKLVPVFRENTLFRFKGVCIDITERKVAEEEIYLKSLALDQIKDQVTITNLKGEITYVNNAQVELTGYSKQELLSATHQIFGEDPAQGATQKEILENTLQLGSWRGEIINYTKSGDRSIMDCRAQVITSPGGNPIALCGVATDISEQKKLEHELILAKEKAEESDRLKSAFLTNMSHEIRTPMNGILGFAHLLKSPNLEGEDQQKYIRIIEKSGARLLNIINDIIDISKIESGQMEISISEININEQIECSYSFFLHEAEKKGLQISYTNSLASDKAIVRTDHNKFYSVLTNLIKNAIKYTPAGSIEFGYKKRENFLEFFVKDTGIGISDEEKTIIFERFRQGDDLARRYNEGSGLGLTISKAYVEMLGGKIWVDSKPGEGSDFYFTIPYTFEAEKKEAIKHTEMTTEDKNLTKNLKILIAEDDETSYILLSIIMKNFSSIVLHAVTGAEAVEVCRNNPDIDLAFMDIRLPEMNGYEATKKIREFNKEIIIIAQTAYGLTGDREKAIKAGCNDYFSKPIDSDSILELVHKYFTRLQ